MRDVRDSDGFEELQETREGQLGTGRMGDTYGMKLSQCENQDGFILERAMRFCEDQAYRTAPTYRRSCCL